MKKYLVLVILLMGVLAAAAVTTKKVWLCIDVNAYQIEEFRRESTFNIDVNQIVEVEVTLDGETKEFTYEEFFGRLGFGSKETIDPNKDKRTRSKK